ncbi:MAG: DMT family transporter [Oscillibacter sp.]|jgi:drug/metabolite transporter (DMT)-like permease|nr:DMT family transporter [Oscillibacter sp.]
MKVNYVRQTVLPLLAALIWGTAFVAQSIGAEYVGPFTLNAVRSAIAVVVLLFAGAVFKRLQKEPPAQSPENNPHYYRDLAIGGTACGAALTLATNFQQAGIATTSSGKAGFITALYIVIVPVLGIFVKKRVSWPIWISVALAVAGLYFLCVREQFTVAPGDVYLVLCALCFSVQILLVDHYVEKVDGLALSCVQFLVVAAVSGILMLRYETPTAQALYRCMWPLLYLGVFSNGVAYTLQILAQKGSNPTVVSLLLSLEAVFATLAGALILHDRMIGREYAGCALMLCAVVLAQIPLPSRSGRKAPESK